MGKEKLIRDPERSAKLNSFDAKRQNFAPYLASFVSLGTSLDADFIPDCARALFKTRQDLRENARRNNLAFLYDLDNPAHEKLWKDSCRLAPNKSVTARLKMIRLELLKEWVYPDKVFPAAPAGETAEAAEIRLNEQTDYKEVQDLILSKYMDTRTKLTLQKLRESVFGTDVAKVQDIKREGLRHILCTDYISNYLCGKQEGVNSEEWFEKPWLNPAIQAWCHMLETFEGISDLIEGNIIEKLTETMESINADGTNESLVALKQSLFSELTNSTKAFSDIPSFVDHIFFCLNLFLL